MQTVRGRSPKPADSVRLTALPPKYEWDADMLAVFHRLSGRGIAAGASAFQADDASSTLAVRSKD